MLCEYEYRKKRYRKNITLSRIKGVIRNQIRESKKLGLKATLTEQQWEYTKQYFNNSCAYCGNDKVNLEQDHLIPMTKGGNYVMGNIIPACRRCNSSKRNNDFIEWYKKQPFFNSKMAYKVINFQINNTNREENNI